MHIGPDVHVSPDVNMILNMHVILDVHMILDVHVILDIHVQTRRSNVYADAARTYCRPKTERLFKIDFPLQRRAAQLSPLSLIGSET